MAPQVLLKNGNVRERQRVRIDETHFFTEKTDCMFLYAKSTKRTYVFIMHLHKKEKNPESTLKHIAKCDII